MGLTWCKFDTHIEPDQSAGRLANRSGQLVSQVSFNHPFLESDLTCVHTHTLHQDFVYLYWVNRKVLVAIRARVAKRTQISSFQSCASQ